MATVVLVHGSHLGGWSWTKVAPPLRAAGHAVYAPTLTGLGERVHLAHPGVDSDTHITDVANVLVYEDLRDVTLVGWSSGGVVITGVAERAPERLAQLVYLDGMVPADGESDYDASGASVAERAADRADGEAAGTPDFSPVPAEYLRAQIADEGDLAWVLARATPHPIAAFAQPLRLGNPAAAALPRAYVFCTVAKRDGTATVRAVARVRSATDWRYRELAANHLAPITAPQETAELLLALV